MNTAEFAPSTYVSNFRPRNYFVIGASGSGKHLQVLEMIIDRLASGASAIVFDCGRSYRKLCEAIGGTHVTLSTSGVHSVERFGQAPLRVVECEDAAHNGGWSGAVPKEAWDVPLPDALICVDEAWNVEKGCPKVVSLLKSLIADGASFCITGMCDEDVAPFLGISDAAMCLRLSRADFSPTSASV